MLVYSYDETSVILIRISTRNYFSIEFSLKRSIHEKTEDLLFANNLGMYLVSE